MSRRVVWQTRFHPVGRRPLDGGNADGAIACCRWQDYLPEANRERFVTCRSRTRKPWRTWTQIAQLEGIDIIFFGPGDFSQGIGDPGHFDNPRHDEARRLIAEDRARYGKFAGTVASVDTLAATVSAWAYRFVSVGADVVMLTEQFRRVAAAFAAVTDSET